MLHALLPLKDLTAAKTRLAGILSPSERRALMQAMAEDVLTVLAAHPRVSGITLVSDDPGAGLLANQYGAALCSERSLACTGLNRVLAAVCRQRAGEADGATLVLHADLPWLSAGDIDTAIAGCDETGGLLVGSDRRGRGTNLLLFGSHCVPDFRFGVDSCARHLAWAREAGQPARVLQRSGIARDVDLPADVGELLAPAAAGPGAATRAVLERPGLASRLQLALAGLEHDNAQGETHMGHGHE